MSTAIRTNRDAPAPRFVGSAGAQRARAASGTFQLDRDLKARLDAATKRAEALAAENAVLRAELDIRSGPPSSSER